MLPYRRYVREPSPAATDRAADKERLTGLPYRGNTELGKVEAELRELFSSHGHVLWGTRHAAPCNSWRSERILLRDETLPRFAYRVHVFQEHAGGYGRYLGFVSLRPRLSPGRRRPKYRYTSVAHIAPPQFMLRPRYHLVTCMSGPSEGVLPFRCAPFCAPNVATESAASCLHAALHQALLLKAVSFGFKLISSQDMITLLWQKTYETRSTYQISREGATLGQALEVLRDPQVGAGGVLESICLGGFAGPDLESRKRTVWVETQRCITDYLANGLPLIVEIEAAENGEKKKQRDAHVIMVLGMHLIEDPEEHLLPAQTSPAHGETPEDIAELPGRFVAHDVAVGPFTELRASELMDRAWIADRAIEGSGIHFLAIAPPGASMGIYAARRLARWLAEAENERFWETYRTELRIPAAPPETEDRRRYVTRLLQTDQIKRRYFSETSSGQNNQQATEEKFLEPTYKPEQYWWCVEVYIPGWRSEENPAHDVPPALVFMWHIEDDPLLTPTPRAIIRCEGPEKATLVMPASDTVVRNYGFRIHRP